MARPRKPQISEDALVQKLVSDPARPEAKLLSGYLGRSDRDGYWRLYQNLEFNEYLEIPEAEILHVEKLGTEGASQAGAWVWVKPDAKVEHVRGQRRGPQGEFLQGDISRTFLGASAGARLGGMSPAIGALPATFTVTACATCPTDDGRHTCLIAVCTLATSCFTTVPIDRGCGDRFVIG